mmetsp:Transcript_1142/g.2519  ORF Transcript_1142/g.2519 Transcript_1142/m.2519 type:complete len:466 (-) Transcript_1142:64-1461(-)
MCSTAPPGAPECTGEGPEGGHQSPDSGASPATGQTAEAPTLPTPNQENQTEVRLLCMKFSQDGKFILAGTTIGWRVIQVDPPVEKLRRERRQLGPGLGCSHLNIRQGSSVFTVVSMDQDGRSTERVRIWLDKTKHWLGEIRTNYEVKKVLPHKDIVAVVCERNTYVYTFSASAYKMILSINTAENSRGIAAMTATGDPWVLACPGEARGEVRVQTGTRATITFKAHDKPIAFIALSESGKYIATVSDVGSRAKVFRSESGTMLYRLRIATPGVLNAVSSMAFHPTLPFLGVACSTSDYVYLFHIPECSEATVDEAGVRRQNSGGENAAGIGSWLLSNVSTMLPEYFTDTGYCCYLRLPEVASDGTPAVDTRAARSSIQGPDIGFHQTQPILHIVNYDGMLHEVRLPDGITDTPAAPAVQAKVTSSTLWFATRPNFQMVENQMMTRKASADGTQQEEEGEEWEILG